MVTTKSLTVGHTRFVCHLSDRSDDAPAIVMIHGIGGRTDTDFPFLFPMLARTYTVLAIDLGAAGDSRDLTLEDLGRQVGSAIDSILPQRPIFLLGYSLGALIAATVASSHTSISRLILIAGWLHSSPTHKTFGKLWRRLRNDQPAQREFARLIALSPTFINECKPEDLAQTFPFSAIPISEAHLQLIGSADLRETAARITPPTLVIGCSADALSGLEQSEALAGAIPNATFAEIPSGHAAVVERPAQLLSLITGFLPTATPARHSRDLT
ncbi:hypothetical protein CQ020_23340 [Arthrobacter sp. MYb23]|uniref:alpha/beta fold hydrolase n=1 Tax=unclassified Arthrobacter TaxID=235627 RepID=UPI000CFC92BC|nr:MULTISPECIES: alpha/beta fold hydrolase [unclassified Arthrobacter]PRB34159.1 hypothetical protein CQ038_23030 [Arthrobacter sp. MYb51]PRB88615.1 hypothetical protein CQ020_23340 [Arthrobacter sp. MYb23]